MNLATRILLIFGVHVVKARFHLLDSRNRNKVQLGWRGATTWGRNQPSNAQVRLNGYCSAPKEPLVS